MERYYSTGQSPRRAVAPTKEEEEEEELLFQLDIHTFALHNTLHAFPFTSFRGVQKFSAKDSVPVFQ
jgi:hypothetical protein